LGNKFFVGLVALIIIGSGVYVYGKQKSTPKEPILGIQHANLGEKHIAQGSKHDAYNSDPASSGPHYADSSAPTQWGVYTQEVPEEVFIHNEEHGGIVVTYNPTLLPADQLKKLQALFAPPYRNKGFSPTKAVVTPRTKDTHAIEIASWLYTLNLDKYDESTIMKYYLQHEGKSPEPSAGPINTPINQAIN
jgi:hypothetical protein